MIAHHIKKAASGTYARLGCYILGLANASDQSAFDRLTGYVVDRDGGGERVVAPRVSNCADDDIEMAIADIEMVQIQNTRSASSKNYHLVISFPSGERPSLEQLRDIEDYLVASIGLADHQRISAIHDDTDNLHMHVAINKVHPTTLRNVDPHRDYPKLMAACRELEIRHGLSLDNHGLSGDRVRSEGREMDPPRRPERAIKMEAHSGRQSLSGWIEVNAKTDILAVAATASSWEAMHEVFARYGLELRQRGAGLAAGVPGSKIWVKASSIDRALSVKAMGDRFGAYQGQSRAYGAPTRCYEQGPRRVGFTRQLYAAYNAERARAETARAAAVESVNWLHGEYAVQLRAYYRGQRSLVRAQPGLSGQMRQRTLVDVDASRKADYLQRDRLRNEARATARAAHPLITWQGFLEREAARGHEGALSALRARRARRPGMRGDLITAADVAAKDVVYQQRLPTVLPNGDVVYRTDDGGRVVDRPGEVRTEIMSEGAAFLALALASERFPGQPLIVNGSNAFRAAVLEMSAQQWFEVTFADPHLERARRNVGHEAAGRDQVAMLREKVAMPRPDRAGEARSVMTPAREPQQGRSDPGLGR